MPSYHLDAQFPQLFDAAGVPCEQVLRRAGLPEDLFRRAVPTVSSSGYIALMRALVELSTTPGLAVRLATAEGVEQFSPPIFAAYCARDGKSCFARLATFKPLIAPVRYRLEELGPETTLYIDSDTPELALPEFVTEGEIVFILFVLRSATGHPISPVSIESIHEPSQELREYAGTDITPTGLTAITFRTQDLQLPFISFNDNMWSFFEPELNRRLSQLEVDDTTAARVRAALVELLPAGESTIEDVARKLATSARTLHRELAKEDTTFRKQLNHVRLLLAKQYLSSTDMNFDSIAFMLGYADAHSFIRAFSLWTEQTPAQYRAKNCDVS